MLCRSICVCQSTNPTSDVLLALTHGISQVNRGISSGAQQSRLAQRDAHKRLRREMTPAECENPLGQERRKLSRLLG